MVPYLGDAPFPFPLKVDKSLLRAVQLGIGRSALGRRIRERGDGAMHGEE